MDLQNLYLSGAGRISRKQFWMGILILIVISIAVGIVVGMVSAGNLLVSGIVSLIFLYPGYNLYAKRFQDMGKPGTYAALPIGIAAINGIATVLAGLGVVSAAAGGMPGMILPTWLTGILGLVGLGILVWVGFTKGQEGPNSYGPDPLAPAS